MLNGTKGASKPNTPAKKKSKKSKKKKASGSSLSVAEKEKEMADFFPSYTPFRAKQPYDDPKIYAIERNDYLNHHGMLWCHECDEEKEQKDFSKDKQNKRNHLHKKNCKACVSAYNADPVNKARIKARRKKRLDDAHEAGGERPCGGMNHKGAMVDATKFSSSQQNCCRACRNAYNADPVNKARVQKKVDDANAAGGERPCSGKNHKGTMVDATEFSPSNMYCCRDCKNAYNADPVNKARRNKLARDNYKFNYTYRLKQVRNFLPIIPDIILSF